MDFSNLFRRRVVRVAGAIVLALLLGACATGGGERKSAGVEPPEERALARWKLLIASEAAKAYDYLSPGVRSSRTREAYAAEMTARPVRWESVARHGTPVCETPDACIVKVLVTYSMDVPLPNVGRVSSPSVLEEKWILIDGVWYHVPSDFSVR